MKLDIASFEKVKLPEIRSVGYLCHHQESGARIAIVRNDDPNKVFCAGFVTPVTNNRGAAHVLEHCLLSGNAFDELEKWSLHTYLNAITFRDKTIYPFASWDEEHYFNMMDVYLNCIFNPMLTKALFLRERTIVHNEMLGANSTTMGELKEKAYRKLFPETYNGAGDPSGILTLQYEEMLAYYRLHYTAGNSFFYFYGDLNIDKALYRLGQALSKCAPGTKLKPPQAIKGQVPGLHICPPGDHHMQMMMELLAECFPREINFFDNSIFAYDLELLKGRINLQRLKTCIRKKELYYKENDFGYRPKGLALYMRMLPSWVNGENTNPLQALQPLKWLKTIEKDILPEPQLIHSNLKTNGILHICYLANAHVIPQQKLPYLGILAHILGKEKADISQGGLSFSFKGGQKPKFILHAKCLKENAEGLFTTIHEVITQSRFNDKRRLKELLQELADDIKNKYISESHTLTLGRVASYLHPAGWHEEAVQGTDFFLFLTKLLNNFDEEFEKTQIELAETTRRIFSAGNGIQIIFCRPGMFSKIRSRALEFNHSLFPQVCKSEYWANRPKPQPEYFILPTPVHSVAAGLEVSKDGAWQVAASILEREYLIPEIRVKGGAYGCLCQASQQGFLTFHSYRDPHVLRTLQAFNKIGNFLQNMTLDIVILGQYIERVSNIFNKPKTNKEHITLFLERMVHDITEEQIVLRQQEIKMTTLEKLQHCGYEIAQKLPTHFYCAAGSKETQRTHGAVFTKFVTLYE